MYRRDGDNLVVVTPQGGSVLSWQRHEHQILGPARMVRVGNNLKLRGETHWCFPNFGPVPAEVLIVSPQHGGLRDFLMEATASPMPLIPRGSRARFERANVAAGVSIMNDQLHVWLTGSNKTKERMPVLPALHPYFAVPPGGFWASMDHKCFARVDRTKQMSENISGVAKVIPRTGSVSVELGGIGRIAMTLPNHCTHIVVWSDKPQEYVCVEPVFGTPGTFGKEEGQWLEPGEGMACEVTFQIQPHYRY